MGEENNIMQVACQYGSQIGFINNKSNQTFDLWSALLTLVEHVSVFDVGRLWTVLQFLSSCMEEQSARDWHTAETVDKVDTTHISARSAIL